MSSNDSDRHDLPEGGNLNVDHLDSHRSSGGGEASDANDAQWTDSTADAAEAHAGGVASSSNDDHEQQSDGYETVSDADDDTIQEGLATASAALASSIGILQRLTRASTAARANSVSTGSSTAPQTQPTAALATASSPGYSTRSSILASLLGHMFPRQLGSDDQDEGETQVSDDSDYMDEEEDDDGDSSDDEYGQDPTLSLSPAQQAKVQEGMRALKAVNASAGASLLLTHEIARVPDPNTAAPWWAYDHLCAWHSSSCDKPPASPLSISNRKRKLSLSSSTSTMEAAGTPRRRTSVSSSGSVGPMGTGFTALHGGVMSHSLPGHRGIHSLRALRGREIAGHEYQASPEFQVLPNSRLLPNQRGKSVLGFDARPYSGQFSTDGTFFYVCTQDFRVHMYDSRDPLDLREYKTVRAHVGQWTITDATLTSSNERIAYSSITPYVHIASTDPDAPADDQTRLDLSSSRSGGRFGIWSLRFSSDGRELVAGTSANSVVVYDVERKTQVLSARGHVDDVNAVCFADQSTNVMYSGSDDSLIKVWDRRSLRPGDSAKPVGVLPGHTEGITFVSSRGDGRYLVSNGKDQCAKLWDVRKMVMPSTFDKLSPDMRDLRLDWDYRWQAFPLGSHGPAVRRHPMDASVVTFVGHSVLCTLIRCHFAPGNLPYVVTGSAAGKVVVYNMLGQCVRQMQTGNSAYASGMHGSWRRENVVRDVAWHPEVPIIMATTWTGEGGAVARHEYAPMTGLFDAGDYDPVVSASVTA